MLKITVIKNGTEQRLMVEGKLADICVSELDSAWNQMRRAGGSRSILVDLSGVTLIDSKGEAALKAMAADGALLTAKGLYCEFVVNQLIKKARKMRTRQRRQTEGSAKESRLAGNLSRVVQCPPSKEME